MTPKYCVQCGYEIIEDRQPAGFCSEGCADVHFKLHDVEFERAERELRGHANDKII